MSENEKNKVNMDRRQFLRSVFGLGSLIEDETPALAQAPAKAASRFFWSDLKTGQIGFPCGYTIPVGQPGSIMKLVSAAALTDAHLLSADEKFDCRGVYKLHNEIYKCQKAHGIIDMVHAIGLSCNIYFAHAAQKLSSRTVLNYAAKFGLNESVGKFGSGKFPHENSGSPSEKYVLGLADDLQLSSLQILRMSALIANEGKIPFMHSAEDNDPNGKGMEIDLADSSWRVLKQGMQMAAREGTGKGLDPENKLKLAIKTGTTPHGKTFQSWITGFFPWDSPRYSFVLRAPSGTSQDEAVPQARKFLFSVEWP
ncbi:MAG: hypothetical protein K2X27_28650 [Candidatus Obscuribacterales bacterium]|nr:hypothetical protein [Candidatus Obscuribacterales bacterium]